MITLPHRDFAETGKRVSVMGLGTVKFGRNQIVHYPDAGFTLPTDAEIEKILDAALENGITLLDTAPAYGAAEERLGRLLGSRKEKFFIVTKTGEVFDGQKSTHVFTAEHTRRSVEESLRRLRLDRLDCVLVHSSRDDVRVLSDTPVLDTLATLKEEGKIASFGASTYTVAAGKIAVDRADAVMVAYNTGYLDEAEAIAYARAKGKSVLVKKGLASGHIDRVGDLAKNIRFVVDTPGVTSLIFGSLKPANISANINALLKG